MNAREFSPVVALLHEVGSLLLHWRNDPELRHVLVPEAFKTAADARSHEHLVSGLGELFPGVPVLSEEAPWNGPRPDTYWLIDPIDGTASWHEGFSGFATQAAFFEGGRPIYGIVHAPALGLTWAGLQGEGAWRNGFPLPRLAPMERLLLCDNYPQPRRAAKTLADRLPITGYVESGSLGVKCCLVADGTVDLFVKDVMVRDWDIAPAAPILDMVGAFLGLPDGRAYFFDGPMEKPTGVLAARDSMLAEMAIAALPQEGN